MSKVSQSAAMEFKEDIHSNPSQSLTGPEAMAHNVYNHTLLSPRQVSLNFSLSPYQCSRLVGGRASVSDRVIESLASTEPKGEKEESSHGTKTFNNDVYSPSHLFTKVSSSEHKDIGVANSTCTSTIQTVATVENHINDTDPDTEDFQEGCDENDDYDSDENDKDEGGVDVEEFIQMHLATKQAIAAPSKEISTPKVVLKENFSLDSLQDFVRQTDEIIKQNLLLQHQLNNLKRDTISQTKLLTKLLMKKKNKKMKTKPYDKSL